MTNEEAKFMLQGYRPNGEDADNDAFAEALAQADRDPSLRAWFEREQAFDAMIAGKLREVAPPAGLRESILAGTRMSTQPTRLAPTTSPAWWRGAWGLTLAAAAAIALVATLWFGPGRAPSLAVLPGTEVLLQTAMSEYRGEHPMGLHADEMGEFGRWLEADGTRLASGPMPVSLAELHQRGCRVIEVAGHELFEICFQRDGNWFHVYLAPRKSFDPSSLHDQPMFHEQGEFVAASWADEKFVYLVSSTAGMDALRGLL